MKRKELTEKLKPFWKEVEKAEDKFFASIDKIEKKMQKEVKIKDLIIFFCDGSPAGIGNDSRTIKLIQQHQLEK